AHGRAAADDRAVRVRVHPGGDFRGRLAHAAGDLERLTDDPPELLRVERFEQAVVGALLDRLDGGAGPVDTGESYNADAGVDGADGLVFLQDRLVGKAQVEDNDVD